MKQFPVEFQLLLLCSSYFSDKENFLAFINSHSIDWALFLALTQRHRVLPMVYHNIHHWNINVPIKNDLKIASLQHTKNALQQTALLLEINKLFQENNIECLHFKGPTLSYLLYQESSLRQYRDIDLLIEKKDIQKSIALLIQNGFELKTPYFKKEYLNIRYQLYSKDHLFEKYNCQIELHWSLSDLFNNKINQSFFSNKKTILLHHQSIQILDEPYYLSYLMLHGCCSGWTRLHWLIDIVDFIKTHSIDWQKIKNIMEMAGYSKALDEVIELLFLFFSIEIPINRNTPKKLIKNAKNLLQLPIKKSSLSQGGIHVVYRQCILLNKKKKKKISLVTKLLISPPVDWQLLPLPKSLFFLYYPLRPFLWMIRKIR